MKQILVVFTLLLSFRAIAQETTDTTMMTPEYKDTVITTGWQVKPGGNANQLLGQWKFSSSYDYLLEIFKEPGSAAGEYQASLTVTNNEGMKPIVLWFYCKGNGNTFTCLQNDMPAETQVDCGKPVFRAIKQTNGYKITWLQIESLKQSSWTKL